MTSTLEKPDPLNLSHHLNDVSRRRKQSSIKGLYKYFQIPGMANLAGGLPYPAYFPYDTLESESAPWSRFTRNATETPLPGPGLLSKLFSSVPAASAEPEEHITVPKFAPGAKDPMASLDLATALQYGQAGGIAPLYNFLKEFSVEHLHGGQIPYKDPDIVITCGSTDGFGKILATFGSEGDSMLVEKYCYMNAVQTATPLGIAVLPVEMDDGGMCVLGPGGLKDVLESWDVKRQGRKPHLMYTVSVGQNPTGVTVELERRKQIYDVCSAHDILIAEDDPYFHLQFTESSHRDIPDTKYPFLRALTPSYVTIDIDGRVLRLDTFSKTVAPGCRLGWITAAPHFVERILRLTETSTQQPSGFVQALIAQLLVKQWGMDGWVTWMASLRDEYERRMQIQVDELSAPCEAITAGPHPSDPTVTVVTKTPLLQFKAPAGGMFVWVKVALSTHPSHKKYGKARLANKLWEFVAENYMTLPSPGGIFAPTTSIKDHDAPEWFRFCFAAIDEKELRDGTRRFVDGVKAFWKLEDSELESLGGESVQEITQAMRTMRVDGFGC